MWTPAGSVHSAVDATNKGLQKSCGEKGMAWPLSERERVPQPLPGQAFIGFLIAYVREGSHSLCAGLL